MRLSLYLTAGDDAALFLETARRAEALGLAAIWLAEGAGLFAHPAVLAAAAAVATGRIALRAGGLTLPLHNPIRVAEEWALVDNLSRGRAGIAFGRAFCAAETAGVETVRRLWRGEAAQVADGEGRAIEIRMLPMPLQPELPLWSTDPETAAALGAALFVPDGSREPIAAYRAAGGRGGVTVAVDPGEIGSLHGPGVEEALRIDLDGALDALASLEIPGGR